MSDEVSDLVEFDEMVALALAQAAASAVSAAGESGPGPDVKARLMASLFSSGTFGASSASSDAGRAHDAGGAGGSAPDVPAGFTFRLSSDPDWQPHPVPGIRMKVLAMNTERGYATLLLDVAPGTRFPPHHHEGAEECYVVSGTLFTCGRRMGPGDFLHADGETDHGELFTEEGCRVLLVVPPEDYM